MAYIQRYTTSTSKIIHTQALKQPKLVVAHFMVGNTAPYTVNEWEEDIKLASKHGIDGFALNVGREDWQISQTEKCFDALRRYRSGQGQGQGSEKREFKLFFSFDMSSIPSSCPEDINHLKAYIEKFATSEHYLRYEGRALISTFAGETSLFGCEEVDSAWCLVRSEVEEICPIFFMPCFFIDPGLFPGMTCLDGAFNWNGCWPTNLTPSSPLEEIRSPKLDSDIVYIQNLRGSRQHMHGGCDDRRKRAYMASVSPWFFTHYGEESWNKNWIYRCDDWLFVRRWMQLIDELHSEVDIVQILSWNDYGESHYIGPIKGAQPNSEDWVNGFSHLSWLDLCSHFTKLFKPKFRAGPTSGSNLLLREWARHNYQSQHYQQQEEQQQQSRTRHHHYHHHSHHREQGRGITYEMDVDEDRIYAWGRSHPRDAVARSDSVGKPKGWQLTDDRFWVVIFAKQDAEVLLWSSSDSESESATNDGISLHSERRRKKDVHCHHPVPKGLSTYSCQLVPGGGMHVQLSRDDVVIKQYHSSSEEFTFQKEPRKYNFNAFVGMA